MSPLLRFLIVGYLVTIAIETPILMIGLSARHTWRRRLAAGVWLTACTYPVVVVVLPILLANWSRPAYLVVAEIFAPVTECALFWLAFGEKEEFLRSSFWRDMAAIVRANLASFGLGEVLGHYGWF
jgi:hypothetical protein